MLLFSTEKINTFSIISNNKRNNIFENSAIQCNVNNLKGRCTVLNRFPQLLYLFRSYIEVIEEIWVRDEDSRKVLQRAKNSRVYTYLLDFWEHYLIVLKTV